MYDGFFGGANINHDHETSLSTEYEVYMNLLFVLWAAAHER